MTPPRLRGLGARRLSNRTDESTSIERQGEQIEGHSKLHDIDLVAITEDVDVSGAISPFDRKDLGPWLTDPDKIAQWDVIIVAKLERLTRSLVHFHELIEWLDRNGKTLISVAESLDLSTPVGRMFANLLAMFAQFQRERTAELRKEAYDKLKANGWWNGGRYKYGYRPVKVDTHWELEIDQDNADIINWIAERILAGHSRMGVGRMLEERGVPAPFGGTTWGRDTVARVLIRSQELIDEENRYKVLDALDSTKHTYTRRGDATMLLNVGFCGHCKKPLYAKRNVQKGKYLYKHYYCPGKCGARFIKMPDLDQKVSDAFLDSYGNVPTVDKSVTQGRSHLKEIMAIEQQIRDLDLDDPD
ncbi:MAG: recombinase family protein, partial [bacterium]